MATTFLYIPDQQFLEASWSLQHSMEKKWNLTFLLKILATGMLSIVVIDKFGLQFNQCLYGINFLDIMVVIGDLVDPADRISNSAVVQFKPICIIIM